MARFDRLTVFRTILDTGAIPTIRPPDLRSAIRVVDACSRENLPVVEILNRGEGALGIFRDLAVNAKSDSSDVILGAGSIYDAPTAALFIAEGANFIVSPIFSQEIARLCNRRKVAYLPGCSSATEISQAEEYGAEIVKLFPAAAFDGPAFIRGILGPSPWSRLMPTNVVASQPAVEAWFTAGAAAVGIGLSLFTESLLAEPDTGVIAARIGDFAGWVRDARLAASAGGRAEGSTAREPSRLRG